MRRLTALDLCCGAGGLALGLRDAGFEVLGIDRDPDAVATHVANVGPAVVADLATWRPDRAYDLVAGGVPCQPFSAAGRRAGFADPRGRLYLAMVRVCVEARARAFVLENVRGLTFRPKGGREDARPVDVVEAAFRAVGFQTAWRVLDAADYGVPQRRQRLILWGVRGGAPPPWPAPTHGAPGNAAGLPPWTTVREALGLAGAYARGRRPGAAGWSGERYVAVDTPAPAVTATRSPDLLAVLDAPSPTVTCREQNSATAFGSRGAATRPRRAGDVLNPALAVLDRPAATVSGGGTEAGGGVEVFGNAAYRARLEAALAQAGLADRPATTVLARDIVAPAGHHEHVRRDPVDPLAAALGQAGLPDRPATTINCDPRVNPAGHHANLGHRPLDPLAASGLLDRPSTTVDTTNGVAPAGQHHRQKRAVRLTAAQCAALQDFPPGFAFVGNKTSVHRQIGNACPRRLAAAVGGALAARLRAAATPDPAREETP